MLNKSSLLSGFNEQKLKNLTDFYSLKLNRARVVESQGDQISVFLFILFLEEIEVSF